MKRRRVVWAMPVAWTAASGLGSAAFPCGELDGKLDAIATAEGCIVKAGSFSTTTGEQVGSALIMRRTPERLG